MPGHAVISDPGLPFLELAWSPHRLAELFNRHTTTGDVLVSIGQVIYTPGSRCLVRCSLTSSDDPLRLPRPALVTMSKDDRFRPIDTSGDASYIDEYRCLLELFPTDCELPTLRGALSGSAIAPVLATAFEDPDSAPITWRPAEVLHYRPHRRCVLSYTPDLPHDELDSVIVKVYPPGPQARQAGDRMAMLRPAAASAGLDIPKPLALSEHLNVLIMGRAAGTSVKQRLRAASTKEGTRQTTALAAGALAALHSLLPDGGLPNGGAPNGRQPQTLATEIRRLHKRVAAVSLVAPGVARAADATIDRLERSTERHPVEIVSVGHGDFTLSQLLADGDRVAMVDFDRTAPADPALDVGNLMGKLRRDALDTPAGGFDGLSETFLAQYESMSGRRNGFADRARLVEVLTIVRWALRSFVPGPSFRESASAYPLLLLEEANRCLTEC